MKLREFKEEVERLQTENEKLQNKLDQLEKPSLQNQVKEFKPKTSKRPEKSERTITVESDDIEFDYVRLALWPRAFLKSIKESYRYAMSRKE